MSCCRITPVSVNLQLCVTHVVFTAADRLVGLVVKASASRAQDPGFESRLRRDFAGSSHTSDLKIDTPSGYLARRLAL